MSLVDAIVGALRSSGGTKVVPELHTNQLSAAEDERLALLIEELGEVIQVLTVESAAPAGMVRELGDVVAVVFRMLQAADVSAQALLAASLTAPRNAAAPSFRLLAAAGDVLQVVGKIQRHGYASYNPTIENAPTNRQLLEVALGGLQRAIASYVAQGDVSMREVLQRAAEKRISATRWLHHQPATYTD